MRRLKPKTRYYSADYSINLYRYLWETEQPTTALSFFNFGLSLGVDRSGPICNPAVRLLGHIALDLSQPRAALEAYQETLTARLKHSDPNSPVIADVYDSIACAYTEVGDVSKAFAYLDKAKAIHFANDPNRMARTSAIYAMTYLRAGQPDQALESIKKCWELQGLTEGQIAVSRYPKHSGDIVLLARIYHVQGDSEAALELASKSITIRKGILGSKGPRVADSMFIVASILREGGKQALATKFLRDIIDMSKGMVEMKGHLARALWTLGTIEENGEAENLKQKAREVRETIDGREAEDEDTDEAFSKLVGWMLW
jgi:tetratricopeptide (TPR) repeat protein